MIKFLDRSGYVRSLALAVAICGSAAGGTSFAQTAPAAQPAQRTIGTVKAVDATSLTLATDAGSMTRLTVDAGVRVLRLEPGQTDMKSAAPASWQDIQVGDRVLARGRAAADGTFVPTLLVLMKGSDLAQKHEQERIAWQRNGTGGLVKSVDAATGDLVITIALPSPHSVTVHATPKTVFRRYAPGSVKFEDAKPGTLADVRPGDQLRARGTKNADGMEWTADEVVSGAFRNLAGTVVSADAANGTVTIVDLATKKQATVKVSADSQVRQLPPMMAQMLANRLKGGNEGASQAPSSPATRPQAPVGEARGARAPGAPGEARPGGGRGDLQQMLSRLPAENLGDLHKGEAVMLVATEAADSQQLTVITMLTGVEPILAASSNSRSASSLLSPWSLGGGGGDEGGGPQ